MLNCMPKFVSSSVASVCGILTLNGIEIQVLEARITGILRVTEMSGFVETLKVFSCCFELILGHGAKQDCTNIDN